MLYLYKLLLFIIVFLHLLKLMSSLFDSGILFPICLPLGRLFNTLVT